MGDFVAKAPVYFQHLHKQRAQNLTKFLKHFFKFRLVCGVVTRYAITATSDVVCVCVCVCGVCVVCVCVCVCVARVKAFCVFAEFIYVPKILPLSNSRYFTA